MKAGMEMAQAQLIRMLEAHPSTAGLSIRIHGDHLIVGRQEPVGPEKKLENDDRVRLTRLDSRTYGLSVKRHTGRWERTPFSGTIGEMVEVIQSLMQHLVAVD